MRSKGSEATRLASFTVAVPSSLEAPSAIEALAEELSNTSHKEHQSDETDEDGSNSVAHSLTC